MGAVSSMFAGISGITANGNALSVVSDNISNVNTAGYKHSRSEFHDIVNRSLKGELGGQQVGRGVRMSKVTPIWAQGAIVNTDRATDLAINGDGFFLVNGNEGPAWTRDGSFKFREDGTLITSHGYRVQGYQTNDNGEIIAQVGDITLPRSTISAHATKKVTINANVDTRSKIKEGVPFDVQRASTTSHYSTGMTVYDSKGVGHLLTVYFLKNGENKWEWHGVVDGSEVNGGIKGKPQDVASGEITFDNQGRLANEVTLLNTIDFKEAEPGQVVEFDFGDSIATDGGTGLKGSTQFGKDSDVTFQAQDGYSAGSVTSMSFDEDGVLAAVYSNGVRKNVGQIVLGKFQNNDGLEKIGENLLKETRFSGQPFTGKPGDSGRGRLNAKALEQSSVDLASEFVSMIQFQRGFQANAKSIQTTDEMLVDLLQLKR